MDTVYGISRWTNASRSSAVHIADQEYRPLCKSKRKVFSWSVEYNCSINSVTCDKCKVIYSKQQEKSI